MLSFEANLTAFTQEIERAIPVLYFAYWIESAAQRAISTRDAIVAGKEKLEDEIDAALEAYETALDEVPILTLESAELERKMGSVVAKLRQLEADLLKRAQQNVEDRHKVPFWRKALGALGAITKVIPWGQPALGYAGAGLTMLSTFNTDDPLAGLEKAPDLIKQVRETDYVSCLKVKQEEGKKDAKSERSARIARVNACAALARAGIKDLREVFKTTAVAEGEVKAELDKLRAADPVFKALTEELAVLTVEKQLLAERLVATMQIVTSTSTIVTEKLLAIQRLDQNLTSVLEVLDHQALLYVANLGRETKDRLLKYQYLMAKAYQYRILKPYTGSFKLAELFDELKALVTLDGAGHDLSREDFDTLKSIYFGELSRITESIWIEYNSNAPARSAPVSFRLSQDELRRLNETGKLSIDLGRRSLFGTREEDLRIVSLATKDLTVRKTGQVGGTATLRLQFEHSGFSRIRSEGHGYLFTHYRTQRANPIVWSTVYSALTERWTETTISAAEESLLRALIESTGAGSDLLLYSRPGALAEIVITKEVTADTSVTLDVEDLVLELVYDYSTRSRFFHDLSVEVSDGLKPLITLSEIDLDGRTDGRGDFLRGYQGATPVRLEAPASYGAWKFKHWEALRGAGGGGLAEVLGQGPVLDLSVADDVAVRAVYTSDESPLSGSFRRGDANLDSRLDISDAVATLGFLFTGGIEPTCLDSADTNDDGAVDLTDGVAILGFLFTGGTAPPSPGPDRCGEDATADSLDCGADPPCE